MLSFWTRSLSLNKPPCLRLICCGIIFKKRIAWLNLIKITPTLVMKRTRQLKNCGKGYATIKSVWILFSSLPICDWCSISILDITNYCLFDRQAINNVTIIWLKAILSSVQNYICWVCWHVYFVPRFCLFVFTLFTIIATVAVLLSAPHIIVQWNNYWGAPGAPGASMRELIIRTPICNYKW